MRALALLLSVLMFWSAGTCATTAAADEGRVMDATQRKELLEWAVHFSERPQPTSPIPAMIAFADEGFARRVCRDNGLPCESVIAAYDAARNEVVYRASLDLSSVWDRSFLVHELVHWIQDRGDSSSGRSAPKEALSDKADCEARRVAEREAYTVQNRYLRHYQSGRRAGAVLLMMFCR